MEPITIGTRLASAVIGPLIRKIFVAEGPGAGLVDKPVRISSYVSFRGEKRSLTEADVSALAAALVRRAVGAGERPVPADEERAVADALATTLHALGDLTLTDLDAVRLGRAEFVRQLRRAGGNPERHLGADATYFYQRLLDVAADQILHFFTQRSTFVARALVEQSRGMGELTAKTDELIRRVPLPEGADAAFEATYLPYVAKKHGKLTIYGIDLGNSPTRWPLDVAYLSLEAAPGGDARAVDGLPDPDPTAPYRGALRHLPGPQPADRALAHSPRVLLRGEAGSGKTTLVQWLAVTAAGGTRTGQQPAYLRDRVPFVLPLRTLTRNGERLPAPKDFLAATDCSPAGTQPAGWEHRVLAAGRGLILVDGIDEIPDAERARARRWLRDLVDTYDGDNRWLVTSRPSAVDQDWLAEDGFAELTLSAMGPADIATFIRRWHAAARGTGRDTAERDAELDMYEGQLLGAVRTKPDLGRLATNPLMCGLICALHRDRGGYLPHGRKDLYEAALSMLLSRRDRERDMAGPDLREEPQLDLLQRLAYWLIKNGRTEMDRARAEDIVGRALPSVPEAAALGAAPVVFEHFLQRSGLLREPAPGTVDFVHRTFQDFLGERAAVEEGDFGLLTRHAADDQWEDVIRMAVALARPAERVAILRDLLAIGDATAPDQPTKARVYLLAAACLEHATTLDPSVREAVQARTASLIPPRNEEGARALAEVGPLVLDLLPGPEGLADTDAYHVVIAASHLQSDGAVAFLSRFADHPSLPVRSQLMWSWSRFDTARYAYEVIARLDPADLDYTVTSDAQLDHLDRLGLRPRRLDIRTGVSVSALTSYLSRHAVTRFELTHDTATDLGFLAGQSELKALWIGQCPALVDLSGMARLPLRDLKLDEDCEPTADEWREISTLSTLFQLMTTLDALESMPTTTQFTAVRTLVLLVHEHGTTQAAIDRLPSSFPRLRSLQVTWRAAPDDEIDLAPLADLPDLEQVHVKTAHGHGDVRGADALPSTVHVDVLR
ncbi:NACHT domain-containing protein [Streptomyces sp. NBC_01565]|uniref:NACHT domain-containing protein n=1 Tax=unclassified Streptomyces TaxID=2593676 RepID=UPI00225820DB|nr:NACHT domain-containing protein [Streptomyces sp. NBC_01565]MCX4540372.1 NACHT domain-containing protein [Streptomyces sp. NBC_01565]